MPADLQPHLAGLATGRLRLSRCAMCGADRFPPRPVCGACSAEDGIEWVTSSGRGEVWSFAVFRKHYLPAHPPPYVVAVVRLAEGPKMISNVVGADPAQVRVGMAVEAVFEPAGDDGTPPRALFRPVPTSAGGER